MSSYNPKDYWENRLKSRFTLESVGNIVFDANYNKYLYKLQIEALKRAIEKHRIGLSGAKVLDIGCGTGFFSEFYIRHSADVTGIDITDVSIESLRRRLPDGHFIMIDISTGDSSNHFAELFDLMNVFNVLYHIVDDNKLAKAIENILFCLKSGGYIFITDNLGEKDFSPAEHVRFRGIQKYRLLFQNKAEIVDVLPIYHFMNRKIGSISLRTNNFIAPLLFALDTALNKSEVNFMSNMKLLVARKMD